MGDEQDGPPVSRREQIANERLGGLGIQMRGRFVQDQDGGFGEESPRERKALALAARELRPLLADHRLDPGGKRADPVRQLRTAKR